ncbi:chain-length determining protein [Rathayibacter sp. YIM 133350]|uniref:chain-length determining protein n=1 Tax=Rathayibacter sp. YIM 133350 TaxID=3131992 RepID=UPI00307E374A
MDPLSVVRALWRYKWLVLPTLVIAVAAACYVYFLGPRAYESTMSYAVVNPQIPTEAEIEEHPELGNLNSDNPYLRSTDPNLIANVVMTRLNSPGTAQELKDAGLGTEFTVSPGIGGSGLIVRITGVGSSPEQSIETTTQLGKFFERELSSVQKINGADDRYLFTSLVVAYPDEATEQFSSRLRAVVVVGVAGIVLLFGAVSLGRWLDRGRARRRGQPASKAGAADGPTATISPLIDGAEAPTSENRRKA